jgi:hypothetical protein
MNIPTMLVHHEEYSTDVERVRDRVLNFLAPSFYDLLVESMAASYWMVSYSTGQGDGPVERAAYISYQCDLSSQTSTFSYRARPKRKRKRRAFPPPVTSNLSSKPPYRYDRAQCLRYRGKFLPVRYTILNSGKYRVHTMPRCED